MSWLELYLLALPLLFGALIGSFLNVVILRWPAEQSIIRPGSACPVCHTAIAWYDNLPILSWMLLRARCRHCRSPISWRYPAIEALTAVLSLLTFWRFIPEAVTFSGVGLLSWAFYFSLVAGLVAITFIDLEHYLIPDEISLGGIPVGIVGSFLLYPAGGALVSGWESIQGAVIGAGVLLGVRVAYQLLRKQEGMGLGDVKMMGLLGAFLGPHPALLFILLVSSLLGALIGVGTIVFKGEDLKYALPFGPFLAVGALIYLLWGYQLAPLMFPLGLDPMLEP